MWNNEGRRNGLIIENDEGMIDATRKLMRPEEEKRNAEINQDL